MKISLPISSRPSKIILDKSKYYKNQSSNLALKSNNRLYIQASKDNIKEIIKIKNTFSKLSSNKIIKIYNITNNIGSKNKPIFNITTKSLFRKHRIVFISTNNSEKNHSTG